MDKEKHSPKIIFAAGGTGGHLFPAQKLANELGAQNIEVLFAGSGLKENRYFKQTVYAYEEICSSTPFKGNIFRACARVLKGIFLSFKLLKRHKPAAVIGFGSFHSFPVLCAAVWKKIPILLFEPNAVPGKVNRFFSRWAQVTLIQFSEAQKLLKGESVQVKMPTVGAQKVGKQLARDYFYLQPDRFTFLIFGGSQGARAINHLFSAAIEQLSLDKSSFQVIHITGKQESAAQLRQVYEKAGILSCVKTFEERMELAWSAADLVICRAGAATVAELIAFEIPGILIPYPFATDDHQTRNGLFVEQEVKGALLFQERDLSVEKLKTILQEMISSSKLEEMRLALSCFKREEQKPSLADVVRQFIGM